MTERQDMAKVGVWQVAMGAALIIVQSVKLNDINNLDSAVSILLDFALFFIGVGIIHAGCKKIGRAWPE
jgi:hypothetical protein